MVGTKILINLAAFAVMLLLGMGAVILALNVSGNPPFYRLQPAFASARVYAPGDGNREKLFAATAEIAASHSLESALRRDGIAAVSFRRGSRIILDVDERGADPDMPGAAAVNTGWYNVACFPDDERSGLCAVLWPKLMAMLPQLLDGRAKVMPDSVSKPVIFIAVPSP